MFVDHTCRMKKNGRKFDIGQETTVDCIRYRCMKTIDYAEFIPVYKRTYNIISLNP
jgi:hypothetical protein